MKKLTDWKVVAILQNSVPLLQHSQEEQEQYSKRLCLRVDGIREFR